MARTTVEPIRRRALIGAAIDAIHEHGSLDVTVGQIARRAGVSSALAHHYFGGKEDLILATMRHLLTELGRDVRDALDGLTDGPARAHAIIRANISPRQFAPQVTSAWLVFYVLAQSAPGAQRLLGIYQRRLHSNLTDALLRSMPRARATRLAEGIAAMIDGVYIRRALRDGTPDPETACQLVEDFLDAQIERALP